jgi:hypothetical protein
MMVYKCEAFPSSSTSLTRADWDSITKEDLEFSVGSKQGVWDVKEPLLEGMEDDYAMHGAGGHGAFAAGYPPKQENWR